MIETYDKMVKVRIIFVLSKHSGEENRISRSELLSKVRRLIYSKKHGSLSDRKLRMFIEELRTTDTDGAWICASLKGGYFLARDLKELEWFTDSDFRRALNTLTRVRKQRAAASLLVSPQLELEI
ncbi:MAG: hypothetical protein FVQ79_04230 [Planctomycetes bacterium]|nr:hypothetical protein [Planctomycetota bacterium]